MFSNEFQNICSNLDHLKIFELIALFQGAIFLKDTFLANFGLCLPLRYGKRSAFNSKFLENMVFVATLCSSYKHYKFYTYGTPPKEVVFLTDLS